MEGQAITIPRGRHAADRWAERIRACQASGLTQAAFCQAHGLDPSYFSHWKRKLGFGQGQIRKGRLGGHRRKAKKVGKRRHTSRPETVARASTAAPGNAFVPVTVGNEDGPVQNWACEIVGPNGLRIRLTSSPDLDTLRQWLQEGGPTCS